VPAGISCWKHGGIADGDATSARCDVVLVYPAAGDGLSAVLQAQTEAAEGVVKNEMVALTRRQGEGTGDLGGEVHF
jgi:hypothetical protein